MSVHKNVKRVTTNVLQEMKNRGEKISMLTGYDFSMARIIDEAGIEIILVGDSASNVMAGHETTLPITLDQMIYHASSVVRAVERALIVVDMPFGSYQGNSKEALTSAIRIMKESGGHAVKLEGGMEIIESVKRILTAGIPVMGHLGLTPQSIYKFGTYVVRAKEEEEAARLIEDAIALEEAGCFAIVLEVHDMLGINNEFQPRFLRKYANLYEQMIGAFKAYHQDVKSGDFPNQNEQY
jgi:3-methyl-2-oxobutanoate hydroxymethyltransferase